MDDYFSNDDGPWISAGAVSKESIGWFFNSEDTIYLIAKHIAEADSIGEGYGYCNTYTRDMFNSDGEQATDYRKSAEHLAFKLHEAFNK